MLNPKPIFIAIQLINFYINNFTGKDRKMYVCTHMRYFYLKYFLLLKIEKTHDIHIYDVRVLSLKIININQNRYYSFSSLI